MNAVSVSLCPSLLCAALPVRADGVLRLTNQTADSLRLRRVLGAGDTLEGAVHFQVAESTVWALGLAEETFDLKAADVDAAQSCRIAYLVEADSAGIRPVLEGLDAQDRDLLGAACIDEVLVFKGFPRS